MEHCATPDTIANQSPDAMHTRAGDNAHQQIVRVELGAKTTSLFVGIGIAIGLGVAAILWAWLAEREARLAQYGDAEFRKEQFFPFKADAEARLKSLEAHQQATDIRLQIREELRK